MTNQVIPAQAVEAALTARREFKNQRGMDNAENLMRHILEAAAPHMLADAWESGYTLGYADCANKQESNRRNPHKETS